MVGRVSLLVSNLRLHGVMHEFSWFVHSDAALRRGLAEDLDNMKSDVQVPQVSDPATQYFIKTLLAQQIRPPSGVSVGSYNAHRQAQLVPTVVTDYPKDECWFNCVDYAITNGGRPVFGWAIWRVRAQKHVAQHHAVMEINGSLIDVTLGGEFSKILFVPDNNAPYDFINLRHPFNFEVSDRGCVWFAPGIRSLDFAIARTSGSERARRIIESGRLAGVI